MANSENNIPREFYSDWFTKQYWTKIENNYGELTLYQFIKAYKYNSIPKDQKTQKENKEEKFNFDDIDVDELI